MIAVAKNATWEDVLRYSSGRVDRGKIRRAYAKYRAAAGIPDRCDNTRCRFHTGPLIWNGIQLPLTLDHIDGVKNDNRPGSLQYLCPNCDSQRHTRGGKNKGRVSTSAGGFAIKRPDGKRDYTLPAEPGAFRIE